MTRDAGQNRQTRPIGRSPSFWPFTLLVVAAGLSFYLSCKISPAVPLIQGSTNRDSTAGIMLGVSRIALSSHFYEMADTYFHGGWEHQIKPAFEGDMFQRLGGEIAPRHHIHLGGNDVKEIMPWLRLATIMNPHDVRIYLDAAFWLAHEAARPDLAEKVLLEAQVNNPFNYQIQTDRGSIFLMQHNMENAKRAFDAGLAFWPGMENKDTFECRNNKARLLLYRAMLHEADGNIAEAVSCLREILKLFPERKELLDRIKDLKEGKEPSLLASKVWGDMLKHDTVRKSGDHCQHPGEK